MPTIDENRTIWDGAYNWQQQGDEWSNSWGNTEMLWYGTLLPRVHSFIPAKTILEIAPGFGRWTQYLKDHCEKLIIVDMSQECIDACKERFKDCTNIEYHVNDGTSLEMIENNSIDFTFSFDSLVHVEENVIDTYLQQLSKKLKPNGVGFYHHSNLGEYDKYFSTLNELKKITKKLIRTDSGNWEGNKMLENSSKPKKLNGVKNLVKHLGEEILFDSDNRRARSMSAEKFEIFSKKHQLKCISQELINWGTTRRLIDALSVFTRADSDHASTTNKKYKNHFFTKEARQIKKLSLLY